MTTPYSLACDARVAPSEVSAWDALDAAFAYSDDATVIVDGEGIVRFVTPGLTRLLGRDAGSILGRSAFDFIPTEEADDAAEQFSRRLSFVGADQGVDVNLRRADDTPIQVQCFIALVGDPGIGSASITLKRVGEDIDERQLGLRRSIAVGEYAHRLAADLMQLRDSSSVVRRIATALSEVGLLTGAHAATIYLESPEGGQVAALNGWLAPDHSSQSLQIHHDLEGVAPLLERHTVLDDLEQLPGHPGSRLTSPKPARSILSTPFMVGSRRGALTLFHFDTDKVWWDSDSELLRRVAGLFGRALDEARSEELLHLVYSRGPVATVIRTLSGALVDCNDRYCELMGRDRAELAATSILEIAVPDSLASMFHIQQRLQEGDAGHIVVETELYRRDRTRFWVRAQSTLLRLPGSPQPLILTVLEDITERRRQRHELEWAATHDPLTGVANRTAMATAIGRAREAAGSMPALLCFDIDRFKLVNDGFGHSVGDAVLCAVAARVASELRDVDCLARLGGDEFAIVVPQLTHEGADALATRLRHSFVEPVDADGYSLHIGLTIGIALGADCSDADDLLERASRALHAAKQHGRNLHVIFDEALENLARSRVMLERELRQALDQGQIEVHFQPEFATDDRRITGAEALVRWRHPVRGLTSAAEFIPVAEQSGLIDEIGRFVLAQATRNFAALSSAVQRPDLVLRVNISAREFARPELPDQVRAALAESGLEPHRLCLEMTETTLMDAPGVAMSTFATLRHIGVRFAIDDFGTGYSSLAYLKRFPVDALKIDRSFVSDIVGDHESRAIVESVIGLGEALSLEVIAEGVETDMQLELLERLGCERAQGYLVSPALDGLAFASLLNRAALVRVSA